MAVIWLVSVYGIVHHDTVYALSLVPRTPGGLMGIATMPLVHGSFAHLYINSTLLLVLGGAVLWRGNRYAGLVTGVILLMAGSALWLVGRPGAHIGASVLIYGYFGFLSTRGLFERRMAPLVVALVTIVVYVGLLRGIVPGDDGVSWEGHLCGLLAGVAAARLLRDAQKRWV
jgi:membrane associated rhomboid family serine protease